jgi:signal transduction histidine kinase
VLQRPRQWAILLALSVTLGTALTAAAAVHAIRQVLRQDLIAASAAQRVIHVAKLRGLAERLGGHARGFLLTADPTSLDRVAADRAAFFDRLDALIRSADGDARGRLETVQGAAQEYDEAVEAVLGLRRRGEPADVVARVFEENVRPRKEALDRALVELVGVEEARLDSLDRSTERAASRVATAASGAAVGALLVSLALAVLLARAFQSLRRKQLELETAMASVEQANRDLDAFAGRVAHDLRTPLTPIVLMAHRLRQSSDEKVVRAAERIQRSADAANRLLDGFLAFSRLGRGSEQASARAAPLVRGALDDFADAIAAAGISVEADLDEAALVACGDALFRQVVANLIGNAVKFLAGRDERRMELELCVRDGTCQLEVRDTGPGIPPEALGHVFDPFYRVPGTSAAGSGLGLATVRRIVEAHGGAVSATSTVGHGTTFQVVLPTVPAAPTGAVPDSSRRAAAGVAPS